MAAYGNPGPKGDDMYGDTPEGPAPAAQEETEPGEGEMGETTLIPKTMLAGKEFKVGEEVVFKIKAMHDDQVEIEYATEEGGGEGEEQPPAEPVGQPAPAGGGGMSSMYG